MGSPESHIENGIFLFCDKSGAIGCIKLKELNKEQLEKFVSRYIDHYKELILESESKHGRYEYNEYSGYNLLSGGRT